MAILSSYFEDICGCRWSQPTGCPQGWQRGDPGPLSSTLLQHQVPAREAEHPPVRGPTLWCHLNHADCESHVAVFIFHIRRGTPANGTTKSSVLVKVVFPAGSKSINLHFHPCCTSDQRENKSFLEYSFSFCRSAFLPTPELISVQVVFHL